MAELPHGGLPFSRSDVCATQCRGVATFPEGVPEPPGTLRMIWSARGVRVGISSISRTQCFWFTTLTCPEVCPSAHAVTQICPALIMSGLSLAALSLSKMGRLQTPDTQAVSATELSLQRELSLFSSLGPHLAQCV